MKSAVLDSFAVLAFLLEEPGGDRVLALLEKAAGSDDAVLISAVNWTEVRYMVEKKLGKDDWNAVKERLMGLPIELVPVDRELAELAGELKVGKKMSLGDTFAAALAKHRKMDLYTGDPEFRAVEDEIRIVWLGTHAESKR